MSLELLNCLTRAVLRHAPRAIADLLPFGGALYDIARDAMEEWRKCRHAAERRAELHTLANLSVEAARQYATSAADSAQPGDGRDTLINYLERLPGTVRRSLSRPEDMTGRTVPATLPLERAEDLVPFLPPRPPRFHTGDVLSGDEAKTWRLLEMVGNGGFGEVWRAQSLHDGVEVAVKLCLDDKAVGSLRTEAHLLRRVMALRATVGIVAMRDAQLGADPPFLVYDYVPGGDLTRLIRGWHPEGKRPARLNSEATRLIRHLAAALKPILPIVHRDLKPSNILLEPTQPGRVRPRIADFGIGGIAANQAIERLATTSRSEALTTSLRGAHTPVYASPQQLAGAKPDPRDDVYALGVIWYQLLVGDTVAGPPTDWRDELADLDVPQDAIDTIAMCLATDTKRRPEDASALMERLRPLVLV